jgi:hypothetical protein
VQNFFILLIKDKKRAWRVNITESGPGRELAYLELEYGFQTPVT